MACACGAAARGHFCLLRASAQQPPTDADLLLPLDVSNCHWSSMLIISRHRR
jgi:hypothetical protein